MALPKICYRTVTSDNYEPQQCVGATCTMYAQIGGLEGCLPALVATFQCIEIMERQSAKEAKSEADLREGKPIYDDRDIESSAVKTQISEIIGVDEVVKETIDINKVTSAGNTMKPQDTGE